MKNENIVYRSSALTSNDKEDLQEVEGYAIVFDSPTCLFKNANGKEYLETVDRKALESCDLSDVVFRYNHNDNVSILARTSNNTLSLSVDEHGLKIRASIADTTTGKDIYKLIKRKDIDKMSVAYVPDKVEFDPAKNMYTVRSIKRLIDVSAVDIPAYDSTSISVTCRDMDKAMEEYENKQERARKYKKLNILLNL